MKRKVLIIYTGGTIGMEKDYETNSLRAFDFNHIFNKIPEMNLLECEVSVHQFSEPLDSSDVGPEEWKEIAQLIEKNYHSFDGFLILHGTDTMAYTASALSFMLKNLRKPVILTGSQLPIGDLRTDAKENLLTSLYYASLYQNDEAVVQEVALYFEYKLLRGNRCLKYSAENFDAFISPNYPILGESGVHLKVEEAMLYRTPYQEDFSVDLHLNDSILLWRIFPGINLESLPQIPKIKVLILQVFGSGTIFSNKKTEEVLQKIRNNGTEIVVISQCVSGGISIGKYNNSNIFKKIGAISGHDITAESALAKAMHLIDNPNYSGNFAENFKKNLRGEISEIEE
ncbi:L-asparaginase 1 [Cloacibacterium normanense]|uniref:L-asparaginase 1 n=1 Tax=Cloacibacterium normanense TaxID=237258 RepID=A0A2S7I7K8_9FLAO|nr:asparaginase [Cloacibacterium normanense]PPZ92519.1 L-asparaginase 1 [Cloacibacterium normanense]